MATDHRGEGRRILLVDDDPLQLKLVKMQLEAAGFVVHAALGAAAGEAVLRAGEPPAAIVSDVVMEGIDGFTFCKNLRRDDRFATIPIVLLSSAFDEEEDRALARSFGANVLVTRSASQEPCIEALVKCLAHDEEGEPEPSRHPSRAPAMYADRMLHQVVRLSERKTLAEQRWETLFEHANDAISLLTPEGVILDANRRWEEISGLSREALRGRHVMDFAAPGENASSILAPSSHRSGPAAVAMRRGDGAPMFIEFTTASVDVEGSPTVLAIGRDVTTLVEVTKKLEASEKLYRSLVENVPDVLWSCTKDWKYTFFSKNVVRLSGFTAEEILGGAYGASLGRVHPDDVERIRAARAALDKHGTPIDLQCRWQHRDGRWLWVQLRGVATESGIDGTISDITERKLLEEQLFQSQKLEAIGQLTAGVAHDFNNILAVILMNASQLVESLPKANDAWEVANDIVDAGQRATALAKQLLVFSRRQSASPCALDLNDLLGGMERMLKRAAGARIRVNITPDESIGRVHVDAGQIEQVVMNLVVNARDAIARHGQGAIHIRTTNVEVPPTVDGTPGAIAPGKYVKLVVSDDGAGMDAATQKRIFEPFFTTKPRGVGTGLGLATCYGIVRHAGGFVSVDSRLGYGTTFQVYLPRVSTS